MIINIVINVTMVSGGGPVEEISQWKAF